jgi:eukaryotic-like serine/threonine-protein kinase
MPSASEPERDPAALSEARELLLDVLSGAEEPGTLFGGYVLYEKLGRGGYGVVYRARRVGSDEVVALKQMRGGSQATAEERREFLAGAKTMVRLVHPGIVRVLDFGEGEDCPFFTMPLLEARDLALALEAARPSQAQACRWLAVVARAVDYAHGQCVLHCDLKPANILLDANGAAFVTDFGSAQRLDAQGDCDDSGSGVLSYYMAPEQALEGTRGLNRRADIYSLGVIFYELLTGRVPYEELGFAHWVSALATHEPVRPPRELEPSISRHLEQICLKCLEKEPGQRYPTAALLAEDLEAVLAGWRPLHARPARAASRSVRLLRRHPLLVGSLAAALLFAVVLTIALLSLWQGDREQQQAALETNAFIANSQAGALLFQLREFADRIERCAQRPPIAALIQRGEVTSNISTPELCGRGFEDVSLFDTDGRLLAHWPPLKHPVLGKNFEFRAYFRGARELAQRGLPGAFLGGAYRAESRQQIQFTFAAPVMGSRGEWLGVAAASLGAASAIGQVGLSDASGGGRLVALLGPRDGDRAAPHAPRLNFIIHPRLEHGRELAVPDPRQAILRLAYAAPPGEQFALRWTAPLLVSDYKDPLLASQPSALAAFAPVGHTGYVVAIQTSKSAVLSNGRALASKLAWRAGAPLGVGLVLLGGVMLSSVSRKRKLERRPARTGSGKRPP